MAEAEMQRGGSEGVHHEDLMRGRVAVVTGAGGGIASAICELFAKHGASPVVAADIDRARLDAVVARIEAVGGVAIAVHADLTTREGIDALRQAALEGRDSIDVLVNALGDYLGRVGPFEETDEDEWEALYNVNLLHVLRACRAFIPGMVAQQWGRIVNFSSVEGLRAGPGLAVYSAFKAGIDAFTKSIGVDLARHGVRVNSIAVDRTRSVQVPAVIPPEREPLVPNWTPAGRFGEPADVAGVALFLASELSSWLVGSTLVADGGTVAAGGWYRGPAGWTVYPELRGGNGR
jgi:NAD(P)-dependent dehydrogenase (short-subunit alcohol dehydrogenase family)